MLEYTTGPYVRKMHARAVLAMLWHPLRRAGDWDRANRIVQERWRLRLEELRSPLRAARLMQSERDYERLHDCPTLTVAPHYSEVACGWNLLCPFCWARSIVDTWWAIDWAFFAKPEKNSLRVRATRTLIVSHEDRRVRDTNEATGWLCGSSGRKVARSPAVAAHRPAPAPSRTFSARRENPLREQATPGVLERLQIVRPRAAHEHFWHCRKSRLILATAPFVTDAVELPGAKQKSQIIRRPTRATLGKIVADIHRYPRFIANGSPLQVATFAAAWTNQPLITVRGAFLNADSRSRYRLAIGNDRWSERRRISHCKRDRKTPYRRLRETILQSVSRDHPKTTKRAILAALLEHIAALDSVVLLGSEYDFDSFHKQLTARALSVHRRLRVAPASSARLITGLLHRPELACLRSFHAEYSFSVEDLLAISSGFLMGLEADTGLTLVAFVNELFEPD